MSRSFLIGDRARPGREEAAAGERALAVGRAASESTAPDDGREALRPATLALMTGLFFVGIFAHRFDVLDWPPYTEQAGCHWIEADWLANHGFDLWRLRTEEAHFEDGGPRAYWCSIGPSLLAVGMRVLPSSRSVIVVYRVLTWLASAFILATVFSLVRAHSNSLVALLAACVTYWTPLFSVQVEMLGLDIPMVAVALAWWQAIDRRRYVLATFVGFIPFFVKPSAFVIPLGAAAYFGLLWFLYVASGRHRGASGVALLAAVNVVSFGVQVWLLILGGNLHGRIKWFSDLILWLASSPDVILMTFLAALTSAMLVVAHFRSASGGGARLRHTADAWRSVVESSPLLFAGWFVVGFNIAAAAITHYESRHIALVVPMVVCLLAVSVARWRRNRLLAPAVLSLLLVVQIANQDGSLYPVLTGPVARGWGVLERSREYRPDHQSNVALARLLDREHRGEPLLVAEQLIFFVQVPSLGYVSSPLGDGDYRFAARDENLHRLIEDQPAAVVVAYVPSQLGRWPFPAYWLPPPDASSGHEILFRDRLEPENVVYRHTFDPMLPEPQRTRQYIDFLYSDAKEIDPVVRLLMVGNETLARRYAQLERKTPASDSEIDRLLTDRLLVYRRQLDALAARADSFADLPFFVARRKAIVDERLQALAARRPLKPLRWGQRMSLDTLPQRWLYISPRTSRPSDPSAMKPPEAADVR